MAAMSGAVLVLDIGAWTLFLMRLREESMHAAWPTPLACSLRWKSSGITPVIGCPAHVLGLGVCGTCSCCACCGLLLSGLWLDSGSLPSFPGFCVLSPGSVLSQGWEGLWSPGGLMAAAMLIICKSSVLCHSCTGAMLNTHQPDSCHAGK